MLSLAGAAHMNFLTAQSHLLTKKSMSAKPLEQVKGAALKFEILCDAMKEFL
jgi:hypothetical protein